MNDNKIKRYPISSTVFCFLIQVLGYFCSKLINEDFHHHVLKFKLDDKIPLIEWTSIIYLGCYIFWALSPLIMSKYLSKERYYKYVTTLIILHIIAFFTFLLYPTIMKERLDSVEITSIFSYLINFIYSSDTPTNLVPSVHIIVSYMCFIPFRFSDTRVPKRLFFVQLIIFILISISIFTTRQHYLIDFIVAVILCEVVFFIINKVSIHLYVERFFTKLNIKLKLEEDI